MNNILYLHETSQLSGAEHSLIQLVKNLDIKRFCPIFVLPTEGPFSVELRRLNIDIQFIPMPKIRNVFGVKEALDRLLDFTKKKNIDLIHSNSIRTHVYGAVVGKFSRAKIIWHERNLITTEKFDPDRTLFFMPDAIICNSRAIAWRFARRDKLPMKVSVIHNGVDTSLFNPRVEGVKIRRRFNIENDAVVIGIASRFNIEKGHQTFLKAAAMLLKDSPALTKKIKFLVVGGAVFDDEKDREDYLIDLAGKLRIGDNVIFTGSLSDMPEAYGAMDIMALASKAEPCGRVVSEAMAMGKPLVATNSGGTPEMVVDNLTGILVKPEDPASMAVALKCLIEDKSRRVKMGLAGRRRAEDLFDIKIISNKIENIYSDILSRFSH